MFHAYKEIEYFILQTIIVLHYSFRETSTQYSFKFGTLKKISSK